MKKLLVLAAVAAMGATSAKADYENTYTVTIPGAQAVYYTGSAFSGTEDILECFAGQELVYIQDPERVPKFDPLYVYDKFTSNGDSNFGLYHDAYPGEERWGLLAIMDNDYFDYGAAYELYSGIVDLDTGLINLEFDTPIASGKIVSVGAVPEPTSGLLLLLGVAGLALKRKRA